MCIKILIHFFNAPSISGSLISSKGTSTIPIFLTASAESRAKRRYDELCEKGIECDFEKSKADMEYRDKNDSQRAVAPLKKADDATLIDTTEYDFDGAVKLVKGLILEKTEG